MGCSFGGELKRTLLANIPRQRRPSLRSGSQIWNIAKGSPFNTTEITANIGLESKTGQLTDTVGECKAHTE